MNRPSVQETLPPTRGIDQDQFVFVVCQHGAEPTLKSQLIEPQGSYRLAFSRPGLLTLKIATAPTLDDSSCLPDHWLIRQAGRVLGQVKGEQAERLVSQVAELAGDGWDAIHVFQRDPVLPGVKGFEPGISALAGQVASQIDAHFQYKVPVNQIAEPGSRVLDIVLVEPTHWFVGHHRVLTTHHSWPGGTFPVTEPPGMISRAYLKMAEALAWSGLRINPGEEIVEIGSSPGGASQRLLDMGFQVTGVDPAEMDPILLEHPRFAHWRNKSSAVRRKWYSKFRWLAADANVAPNYTLDAVEDIVTYSTSNFEGLLLTLKLSSYDLAEKLEEYMARIRSWGFEEVAARQLAHNRRECCVVAKRKTTSQAMHSSQ